MLVIEFIFPDPNTIPSKMVTEIFLWERETLGKPSEVKPSETEDALGIKLHTHPCVIPTVVIELVNNIAPSHIMTTLPGQFQAII